MKSEPQITRVRYARTRGWWVRFQRTVRGKRRVFSKLFSDGPHGGARLALAAARQWRDQTWRQIPPPKRAAPRATR